MDGWMDGWMNGCNVCVSLILTIPLRGPMGPSHEAHWAGAYAPSPKGCRQGADRYPGGVKVGRWRRRCPPFIPFPQLGFLAIRTNVMTMARFSFFVLPTRTDKRQTPEDKVRVVEEILARDEKTDSSQV